MNTATEQDCIEFRKLLLQLEKLRETPIEQWPDDGNNYAELVKVKPKDMFIMAYFLTALDEFLAKHTSIRFLWEGIPPPEMWCGKDKKDVALRGNSMLGINFDLYFTYWPDRKEYTLKMNWGEDIDIIALAPSFGKPIRTEEALSEDGTVYEVSSFDASKGNYMQGSFGGVKANTEGFVRLARKLVEIEDTANR